MPARIFVDTNIWLYSLIQSDDTQGDKRHQQASNLLCRLTRPIINSQVIRETCANLIKKGQDARGIGATPDSRLVSRQ